LNQNKMKIRRRCRVVVSAD